MKISTQLKIEDFADLLFKVMEYATIILLLVACLYGMALST